MLFKGTVAQLGGYKIIVDSNKSLIYPSGRKDGNKLGKRKRELFVETPRGYVPRGQSFVRSGCIIMHLEDYKVLCDSKEFKEFNKKG